MTKSELIKSGKCANGDNPELCKDCELGEYDGMFMGMEIYSCKEDNESFSGMTADDVKLERLLKETEHREATPDEAIFIKGMIRRSIKKMMKMQLEVGLG